jgi:pimeloyl-ACP methyl ester carboxylesterase
LAISLLAVGQVDAAPSATGPRQISFKSEDGLRVTADLYLADSSRRAPFIVLFHKAGWSRGEYTMIAPILNKLGFNCMAVDQRSGDAVAGIPNLTAKEAKRRGKRTTFLHALPDMRAALRHAKRHYAHGKLIAWGSSYSAALVLVVASKHPKLVDGVVSFSPGEYFRHLGKPANWIYKAASKVQRPVFMTAARDEWPRVDAMFRAVPSRVKAMFRPEASGRHGSQSLWRLASDSSRGNYWWAVTAFLERVASPHPVSRKKKTLPRRAPVR